MIPPPRPVLKKKCGPPPCSPPGPRPQAAPPGGGGPPPPPGRHPPLPILGKLLELVRGQVRIDPAGRDLRNPVCPHLDLVAGAGQLHHDSVEDVILFVPQQALRAADLLAGLIHPGRLLRHGHPCDLLLFLVPQNARLPLNARASVSSSAYSSSPPTGNPWANREVRSPRGASCSAR